MTFVPQYLIGVRQTLINKDKQATKKFLTSWFPKSESQFTETNDVTSITLGGLKFLDQFAYFKTFSWRT